MNKVYVFLADGFEEIEGLTVVDLLRRAEISVTTVSIMGRKEVLGSHGIPVLADALFKTVTPEKEDLLVLPGGLRGTQNLEAHEGLKKCLKKAHENESLLAAICAAPTIFGKMGFLKGRKAVCYPGMEEGLEGAEALSQQVVTDGHLTTSRGLGTSIPFALRLIAILKGQEQADAIAESIVYKG